MTVEIRDEAWTFNHLPDALETLGVEPRGVLHVGGHHGEEVPVYQWCGFASITLVEPLPSNCTVIRDRHPDVDLVQAACVPAGDGMVSFFTDGRSCGGGLAGDIWKFFKAHPYGVDPKPSPWTGGLPAGFNASCMIF